jgi:hypothetical protein
MLDGNDSVMLDGSDSVMLDGNDSVMLDGNDSLMLDGNFKVKIKKTDIFVRGPVRSKITAIPVNEISPTVLALHYSRVKWHQAGVFSKYSGFPRPFHSTGVPRPFIRPSQPLCNLTN